MFLIDLFFFSLSQILVSMSTIKITIHRGIVKEKYLVILWDNLIQFSIKTYDVGTH